MKHHIQEANEPIRKGNSTILKESTTYSSNKDVTDDEVFWLNSAMDYVSKNSNRGAGKCNSKRLEESRKL